MTYTVFDIETTTRTSYKRKANPFDPENKVVMVGWKRKDGAVESAYYGRSGASATWFTDLLKGSSLLIGHNIKFDILYAIRSMHNLVAWMDWVAAGGMVWDTQLAEYLLNGMVRESHMLALDEVAPVYGGNCKFDEVKALWAAGVDTVDIDPKLLKRYLCGEEINGVWEHGDIGNTELVFKGQLDRARKVGQVKSIMLNMGSLICTIEMERAGMKIDRDLGLKLAEELSENLAAVRLELHQYLPTDLPFEFNWGSRKQLSALLFGGAIKYEARVPILDDKGEQAYAQMDERQYILADGSTTNVPPTEGDTKYVRFSGGKNKGEYKTKLVKVNDPDKPKSRMEDFFYTFKGYTKPDRKWESESDPGFYSTAAEVIAELGNRDIPFLKLLAQSSSMAKDLGTYYIVTDDKTGEQKGMLTLVQPDGLIHHSLNHTSTVTARFSSSNPNLQNIPKEGKSVVKTVFISRYDEGRIIQSDFTALEVYVQAILTQCKQLIEDLKQGLDMHCVRVSQKEHMDYDEVVKLCKGYTLPDGTYVPADPVWDKKRFKAKAFSFQRAYGAGVKKIAESTGMSIEEVEALVLAEMSRYPELEKYYEGLTSVIKANRRPTSRFVQHPDIRGANCQLGRGWARTPDNKLYVYDEQPSPEYLAKRGQLTSFSPTEIKNYVVQGAGGEWAKAAMWLLIREFYRLKNFNHQACLVNQVHDAVYADAAGAVVTEAASVVQACMEAASDFMEFWFDWEVPVPVPSVTVAGLNMMDEGKLNLVGTEQLRKDLRARYMNNYTPSFAKEQQQ